MAFYDVRAYGAIADDSADDTAAIQAALDAAHLAGGGQVYIPKGTFIISGSENAAHGALRVNSNTELFGAGMGATVLQLADGYAGKITGLIRTPVDEATHDVVIRDLTLDGNRANTTGDVDGIVTGVEPGNDACDSRILIENVEIHDVSRIAFNPHEQTKDLTIRNSMAHHNSWDGFVGDFVSNAVYENNVAFANDRHGFNIVTHSHDVVLKDNMSFDNGEAGIVVQRGSGSTTIAGWVDMLTNNILIENNISYGNGTHGIALKQTENSQVIGNTVYENGKDGINLEGARNNVILENYIYDNVQQGIELARYTGTLPGWNASTGNVVADNIISAAKYALLETDLTTQLNLFSGNMLDAGTAKIGLLSILSLEDIYDGVAKLEISVALPVIEGVVYSSSTHAGTLGDDTLKGGYGEDVLYGYDGNDLLQSSTGHDKLVGGDGDDKLKASSGNDILYGGNGIDLLYGENNNDVLYGGNGNDSLSGGDGNDLMSGDAGDDKLMGGNGHDVLYAGAGSDRLYGEAGADTFVFTQDSLQGKASLRDFNLLEGDMLVFHDVLEGFDPLQDAITEFVFLTQSRENTTISVDRDGAGTNFSVQALGTISDASGLDVQTLFNQNKIQVV